VQRRGRNAAWFDKVEGSIVAKVSAKRTAPAAGPAGVIAKLESDLYQVYRYQLYRVRPAGALEDCPDLDTLRVLRVLERMIDLVQRIEEARHGLDPDDR
jgi:hypothetical protein